MGNPQSERIYTIEEYLDFEEQAEEKHEYIDGHIYQHVTARPVVKMRMHDYK